MHKTNSGKKIWCTISNSELITQMRVPGLTTEYLRDFCQFNPQKVIEAVLGIAQLAITDQDTPVVPIAAFSPMVKDEEHIECLILLGGEQHDIEQLISNNRLFERQIEERQYVPTAYDGMKKSAFNLMRKNNIKSFSDAEIHRVFKHAREQLIYTSIVKSAIEEGLTIESLYEEQDRDIGLGR